MVTGTMPGIAANLAADALSVHHGVVIAVLRFAPFNCPRRAWRRKSTRRERCSRANGKPFHSYRCRNASMLPESWRRQAEPLGCPVEP